MDKLISFAYEIALYFIALFAVPKMLYHYFFHKKYKTNLKQRLGIQKDQIKKLRGFLIWMHAISMGETKAMASLAAKLKLQYPEAQFIVSSVTETGHGEAVRSIPFADSHIYLPIDLSINIAPLINQAKPDLVILSESDFWLNFLLNAKKVGAVVALVNGKLSENSLQRWKWAPFFSKKLFSFFDVLCVQSDVYKKRFIEAGADEKKIVVTGNLKFDEEPKVLTDSEANDWKRRFGIQIGDLVLVIGSTHHPEEELIIQAVKNLEKKFPNLKVFLVPRHPERFSEVANLLEKENCSFIRFTHLDNKTGKERFILIDAMGLLRVCYQLADATMVGGSFTSKVGGHNILEPAIYGKPVVFGPYMHTQAELLEAVMLYQAGIQTTSEELQNVFEELLSNPEKRIEIGNRGLQLMRDFRGSTERTLNAILPLLKK